MSISFFGLDTAITGMAANQKALEVTGHNVSNLGTAGYSRQSAILVGAPTRQIGNWHIEMGASVQQIRQIRDLFQDNLVRRESNGLGYWETRYKAVSDLEAIVAEPMKEGLQNAMNQFWDSWQELAKAPESLTIRALVRQRADSLVQYINHQGTQINKLQSDLNMEISRRIEEVNDITRKVRDLNIKIASAESARNMPNDYYDERNLLVDRLSSLLTVDVNLATDGQMDLMVGGYFLVAKGVQTDLVAASNNLQSQFYTPKLLGYDIEVNVGQGVIKGLMEGRGEVSGAIGNADNGSPNTIADFTVLVDSTLDPLRQAELLAQAEDIRAEMLKHGLTPYIRIETYDGSESGLGAALTGLAGVNAFPEGANRFLLIATENSIGGADVVPSTTVAGWASLLRDKGIHTSVLTDAAYTDAGDPGEPGWRMLTSPSHGSVYDEAGDPAAVMIAIGTAISKEIDVRMSTDVESTNIISSARRELNAMLNIMMRQVNYLHKSGTALNGLAGEDLFIRATDTRPLEMGNIRLNPNLADVNNLVAGRTDGNGDNTIALKIANLRNDMSMTGRTKALSFDTYYQNVIMKIGNKGFDAETIMNNQRILLGQAEAIRQSVLGVSMDEEMGNMIKFKYGYNAAAKSIKIVDEMIDTLVNRMGAGRG